MEATEKNMKIAKNVIDILAENGATISEAQEILQYVGREIVRGSFVRSTKVACPKE